MELHFLGRGAGFNPAEGSTSAFFIDGTKMFLIDCGESVFKTILEREILDSVSELNIFITHTHSDHVGSLGSLVLYAAMVKRQTVNIIIDEIMGYRADICALLKIYGLSGGMYHFVNARNLDGSSSLFDSVRYVKTRHCDELASCGLLFETEQGLVFYSGDMRESRPLIDLINSGKPIAKIYIDSNNDREPNPHHLSIHLLNDIVPPAIRPKIFCMHINNSQCLADARAYGFGIVAISD
ncbi:MAG: MBL fold metallo-hydrolase [Treponema sp.]|jgi:ribonuclease BN (tRNA processing enzyme)|nr:MBL fold metallo-hydrolase [Treponema sp.]